MSWRPSDQSGRFAERKDHADFTANLHSSVGYKYDQISLDNHRASHNLPAMSTTTSENKMEYVRLGKSGLKISKVVL